MTQFKTSHVVCALALSLTMTTGAMAEGNIHFPTLPPSVGATMPGVVFAQAASAVEEVLGADTAQDSASEQAVPEAESAEPENALSFLRRLEKNNAGIKTLHGRFVQVRTSSIFLEEIQSRGEFWYSHPNLFRCDYFEPSELRYYLVDNTAYIYTPELNQVDEIPMESGDGAAINQLLVGFGLNVDLITEVFDVEMAAKQPAEAERLTIDFTSKDMDRSLGYSSIRVTFDRESMDPKLLEMEQEDDSVVVRLNSVDRDTEIDPVKFQAEFPANVEIHRF